MYRIEPARYGLRLTFSGAITADEMRSWVKDSFEALGKVRKPFGVIADMRELSTLSPDAREVIANGQRAYRVKGMRRSAVILSSAMLTLQFKSIAGETGIQRNERYIDSTATEHWEDLAERWVVHGIEPSLPLENG